MNIRARKESYKGIPPRSKRGVCTLRWDKNKKDLRLNRPVRSESSPNSFARERHPRPNQLPSVEARAAASKSKYIERSGD